MQLNSDIVDTKKSSLDIFVKSARSIEDSVIYSLAEEVQNILRIMADVFVDKDALLRSSGMTVVYYIFFSRLHKDNEPFPTRDNLVLFEELRAENRRRFEHDLVNIDLRLIEYDELAQSSNDASAIRTRYELLREYTERIMAGEITRDSLSLDF